MHWQILNIVVLAGWVNTYGIGGRGVLWDILESWSRVEKGGRIGDFSLAMQRRPFPFVHDGINSSLLERR